MPGVVVAAQRGIRQVGLSQQPEGIFLSLVRPSEESRRTRKCTASVKLTMAMSEVLKSRSLIALNFSRERPASIPEI